MRTKIATFVVAVALLVGVFLYGATDKNDPRPDVPEAVASTLGSLIVTREPGSIEQDSSSYTLAFKGARAADVCPENEFIRGRHAIYCDAGMDPSDVDNPYRNMSRRQLEELVHAGEGAKSADSGFAAWHLASQTKLSDLTLGLQYAAIAVHHLGNQSPMESVMATSGLPNNKTASVGREWLPYALYAYSTSSDIELDLSLSPKQLANELAKDPVNMPWLSIWLHSPQRRQQFERQVLDETGEVTTWQAELSRAVESANAIAAWASAGAGPKGPQAHSAKGSRSKKGGAA